MLCRAVPTSHERTRNVSRKRAMQTPHCHRQPEKCATSANRAPRRRQCPVVQAAAPLRVAHRLHALLRSAS
ncbi:hypothetical protein D8I24_6131 [Cupriavidus necator H850]|nr:hypothetical protein D8I24_6131 [Cupriavidus necator H850]